MFLMRIVALPFISFLFIFSAFCVNPNDSQAQSSIKGKIINQKNGKPISYASVRIPKSNVGLLADARGMFSMGLHDAKKSDTFFISSVGYTTLKIPVKSALEQSNFYLTEYSKELENVVLKSYTNEATEGAKSDVAGYFKSWSTKKSGGEIGRVFTVNQEEYKVEKIRFKVNNQCESCSIRVRIRDLNYGLPDMELFSDSITTVVKKLSFDDKYSEIDLSKFDIVLKEKSIFISLELLNCSNRGGECSFCFIGTEPGNHLFKRWDFSEWEECPDHSIYLKLYYKY